MSDNLVLKYQGEGEWMVGIPARDLTEGDIADIAEREHLSEDELIKRLSRSPIYKRVRSESKPKSGSDEAPAVEEGS